MCIRCGDRPAPTPGDYCARCSVDARSEVGLGLRQLELYLADPCATGPPFDDAFGDAGG